MTHAMIICEGVPLDVGPIHQVLTSENISAAFGVNVHVDQRETHRGKRWTVSLA
jgi:ABC-type cobalamin/Fe3+-siderophores transport system ATPase subunit